MNAGRWQALRDLMRVRRRYSLVASALGSRALNLLPLTRGSPLESHLGSSDPLSCTYGHVPAAYWLPDLHLMDEAAFIANMTGSSDPSTLRACSGLRLAFICHSGVRSNQAADKLVTAYRDNGISTFDEATIHGGAILNAGGGTQGYFEAGLMTHFGFARPEWPGCVALGKFAATWNVTRPRARHA